MQGASLTLVFCAFAGLSGLGLGSMLLLHAHTGQRKLRSRLARVITPHSRNRAAHQPTLIRSVAGLDGSAIWRRLAKLFGFDLERQGRYPVRWWLVLACALMLARLAAGMASALLGPWAYLLLLPAWVWLSRRFFRWCERRHANKLFRQFPDALATIVRAVRIGIPVGESIHVLAREGPEPTAREFKALSDQMTLGVPLDEALIQVASRNDLPEYRFFATALALQKQAGGGLTETLENLADVIRKRVAARNRARALASEANTSAAILGVMPLFTGAALWLINPDYMYFLFQNPGGQRILALAVLLLGIGVGTMRWLIRKTLS